MTKSGILIDTSKFIIVRDCIYDDKRIDGMFYKVEEQLIPIAYVYPKENQLKVLEILNKCKEAKANYDKVTEIAFYKELPQVR